MQIKGINRIGIDTRIRARYDDNRILAGTHRDQRRSGRFAGSNEHVLLVDAHRPEKREHLLTERVIPNRAHHRGLGT